MTQNNSINSALAKATLPAGIYRHYKGNDYQVIDTVYHSETLELMVLYRPLYGERALWVRPFAMFTETINIDGRKVPRFKLIEAAVD